MSNENKEIDMINRPPHYSRFKFEPINVLQDWFPSNPLLWQVVKYLCRAEFKNDYLEDLEKARFYLNAEIEKEINKRREFATKYVECGLCFFKFKSYKDVNFTNYTIKIDALGVCKDISACFTRMLENKIKDETANITDTNSN